MFYWNAAINPKFSWRAFQKTLEIIMGVLNAVLVVENNQNESYGQFFEYFKFKHGSFIDEVVKKSYVKMCS